MFLGDGEDGVGFDTEGAGDSEAKDAVFFMMKSSKKTKVAAGKIRKIWVNFITTEDCSPEDWKSWLIGGIIPFYGLKIQVSEIL